MQAHQLARLALGCYTMNVSRRGRNVLWCIEITSVVPGPCRRIPSRKASKDGRRKKKVTGGSKKMEQKACLGKADPMNGYTHLTNSGSYTHKVC